jgi:hypothetical protein
MLINCCHFDELRGELKISEAKSLRIHRFLIRRNNIGIISMNNMEENKNMKFKC